MAKKKTEKEYKKYLQRIIDKWAPRLLLDGHLVSLKKSETQQYFACAFRYPYMDAEVLWTEASFKDWRDAGEDQEHAIVHELFHIITDPLYSKAMDRFTTKDTIEDERERLTDKLAIIAYKNFNA